jgi:hypothetical protein
MKTADLIAIMKRVQFSSEEQLRQRYEAIEDEDTVEAIAERAMIISEMYNWGWHWNYNTETFKKDEDDIYGEAIQ